VRRILFLLMIFVGLMSPAAAEENKWQSLLPVVNVQNAVTGEWTKASDHLSVSAAPGARLVLPVAPKGEYDFRVSFTRESGQHSIGLLFVHGGRMCAFEVDAWGQHLAGFQQVGGQDIRQNPTRREGITLRNGQRYTLRLEVRKDQVRGWLDDTEIATLSTRGEDLALSDLWKLPQSTHLAIAAWDSQTTFHAIEVRSVNGAPIAIGSPSATPAVAGTSPGSPMPPSRPAPATGKRVLIVIANQDFFYREYSEPRAELERAGIQVVVAAGRKAASRPHNGTGEGSDGGVVNPDIAISDVKAADYDAILFSGGWGSSMYQFAFRGRYNNALYNGDAQTKAQVNRVINEFLAEGKYVAGLCNAVSVLAWARVDGKSPLRGKRVCAPTREAAAGIYNGRQAQPSCRWHPETNGAILSPAGAIGDPSTNRDDVLVDGQIITGEDDPSAREMGRKLAELLRDP
jgi:putative intracellular protease/amidase